MIDAEANSVLSDLLKHEGCVGHMYQDTHGNVTVGIGELVPNFQAALSMPFVDATDGMLAPVAASSSQVISDFQRVAAMPAGHPAAFYHPGPQSYLIIIPVAVCTARVLARLNAEFVPAIVALMPKFEAFPLAAKRAIVDMAWSLGPAGLAKFHVFITDCNRGDFRGAAFESNRKGGTLDRNQWTKSMLLQAADRPTT